MKLYERYLPHFGKDHQYSPVPGTATQLNSSTCQGICLRSTPSAQSRRSRRHPTAACLAVAASKATCRAPSQTALHLLDEHACSKAKTTRPKLLYPAPFFCQSESVPSEESNVFNYGIYCKQCRCLLPGWGLSWGYVAPFRFACCASSGTTTRPQGNEASLHVRLSS